MHDPPVVDRAWLAERLAERGLPSRFGAIEVEPIGQFSTEVWRLRPSGIEGGLSLILKRPYRAPRSAEPPELEASFYQNLADSVPVRTPRFVARLDEMLILTEVPGLHRFRFMEGPSSAHCAAVVDGLAALHGTFWQRCDELTWIPTLSDRALRDRWQADFDSSWRRHRSRYDELCPDFTPIGDALVNRLSDTLAPMAEAPTLLHGDSHGENLPLSEEGDAVFLDWQAPRIGNAGFDLAIFTAMSLRVRDRRKLEEGLVDRHARSIAAQGIDWADPFRDYRRGLLRRAARMVEIRIDASPARSSFVFERCAVAAVDNGVADLIR